MILDIALIGLASSGKTSLLKALAAGHLPQHTAPNEPTVAVVKVPDPRLEQLAVCVKARKITHLELRLLDFPSFSVGKKGPPAQVLGALSTCDLLVHVVRAFTDESVPHPAESVDPRRDMAALDLELALSDLGVIERRIDRVKAESRSLAAGARGAFEREVALLERLKAGLEAETPIRAQGVDPDELATLAGFNLLTAKALLVVLNVDEADAGRAEAIEAEYKSALQPGSSVIALCVRGEADVAELSDDEAAEFRRELGLPDEPAAGRLLRELVLLLGLITFYTAGEQDTRAWSIPAGTPALKAAGRIHSDIERGFIRAEVVRWDDLLSAGSHADARKKGVLRVEGKQYVVQDGDTIHVLFNV